MRWLIIGVVVLTFAVAGAGCGGGDDEASSTDTTEITDTTTDETTDETTTEDTDTDTGISGDFSSEDCAGLVAASAAIAQAFAQQGQGDLDEAEELFEQFADKVPDELEDDVEVLSEAYTKYLAAIQDVDLQPGQIPNAEQAQQLAAALSSIDTQAVDQAGQNLSTWANANCPGG